MNSELLTPHEKTALSRLAVAYGRYRKALIDSRTPTRELLRARNGWERARREFMEAPSNA